MPGIMELDNLPVRTNKWKAPQRRTEYVDTDTSGLFKDVDPVISQMVSGEAYDPIEKSLQSAMARMEKSQRAGAARRLGGAVGQGMGEQMAQDIEGRIGSQRLQTLGDIAEGRLGMRERGVATKLGRIGQEENIRMGRHSFNLAALDQKQRFDLAKRAQDLQEEYQLGLLSIQELEAKTRQMVAEFQKNMGREELGLRRRGMDISMMPFLLELDNRRYRDIQREEAQEIF